MRWGGRALLGVLMAVGGGLVAWVVTRPLNTRADDVVAPDGSSQVPPAAGTLSSPPPSVLAPRRERLGSVLATGTPSSPISGRVVDETGHSVGGARVVALMYLSLNFTGQGAAVPSEMSSTSVTTAPDGTFAFDERPPHATCLRVEEGPTWSRSLAVSVGPAVTIRVAREPRLAGAVLDPDGTPAGSVRVAATCRDDAGRAFDIVTLSGADGRFALRLPPEVGEVDLGFGTLEGARSPPAALGGEIPGLVVPRTDLVLRLVPGGFLRGQVVDATGDAATASLTAISNRFDFPKPQRIDGCTAADGRFEVGPLRPGRWTLVARPAGPTSTYTELSETAPAAGIVLRLDAASSLIGQVVGDDVAGFEVWWTLADGPEGVRRGTVRADERGEFRIDGLPRAAVALYARKIGDERCAFEPRAMPGGTATWRLVLGRGEAIEGTADGYEGRVIAHQGPLQHEGRASGGTFRVSGLPPGMWTLRKVARSEGPDFAMEWETGTATETDAGATGVVLR